MAATHRFLLVIPPSPEVSAAVEALRERLFAAIGGFSGRRLMPHITLLFSDAREDAQDALLRALAGLAPGLATFSLSYQGITHFPDRRTIYIDPVEKSAVAAAREPIAGALKSIPGIAEGLRVTEHPHLTIAAGLRPAQFAKAWPMLAPHAFAASHPVQELLLLKRALRPEGTYAPLRRFELAKDRGDGR